jgi:hypothetical protein
MLDIVLLECIVAAGNVHPLNSCFVGTAINSVDEKCS